MLLFSVSASAAIAQASQSEPSQASQPYVPTLTFDVASIRQSPMANSYAVGGSFEDHSSSMRLENFRIENILSMAYGVRWDQIVGLKDRWGMFNIQAKADGAADQKLAQLNKDQEELEHQHMLQQLLAERFKLQAHWETRETSTYDLVISKKGLKMQESKGEPASAADLAFWGSRPIPPLHQQGDSRYGFDFIAHACTMDDITKMLSGQFGRSVADKTGLKGKYDFILHYLDARITDRDADDLNPTPTLDQAIQDQLGLKLEPAKGQDRFLIIDHIEKPTEN
jgi:uncharacterized protein (TIGR03435 family)